MNAADMVNYYDRARYDDRDLCAVIELYPGNGQHEGFCRYCGPVSGQLARTGGFGDKVTGGGSQ